MTALGPGFEQQSHTSLLGQTNLRNRSRGSGNDPVEYGRAFVKGEQGPGLALFEQIDNRLGTCFAADFFIMAESQQHRTFWFDSLGQQAFNALHGRHHGLLHVKRSASPDVSIGDRT